MLTSLFYERPTQTWVSLMLLGVLVFQACGKKEATSDSDAESSAMTVADSFKINHEAELELLEHIEMVKEKLPAQQYASNSLLEQLDFTEVEKATWQPQKLKVGLPWILNDQHAPLYIAQKKGFFDAVKLDVELKEGGPARDPLKLLVGGSIDIGITSGGNSVVRLMSSRTGSEVMAIAAVNRKTSYIWMALDDTVPIDQPSTRVLTPRDFLGKSVGLQEGGEVYQAFFLKQFSLPPDQVKFTRAGATPDVLLTGAIDFFGAILENQPRLLEGMGYKNWMAFQFADYGWDDFYNTHVVMKAAFENDKMLLRRYLWALRESVQFLLDRPEEAAEVCMNYGYQTLLTREQVLRRFELQHDSIAPQEDYPILFMNMPKWDRIGGLLLMYDQIEL